MHIEMEFLCAKPFLDVCGHSYDIGISTGVPLVEKRGAGCQVMERCDAIWDKTEVGISFVTTDGTIHERESPRLQSI
jgi:hypothetical protein